MYRASLFVRSLGVCRLQRIIILVCHNPGFPSCVRHGDSRMVLDSLLSEGLGGNVRLVYADPPYNTGQANRGPYNDRRTDEEWRELLADVVSKSQPLLRADGSLWLHINDRQLGTARTVCDEIFGERNYCGTIAWERTRNPSYLHKQLASTLDFILVYGRSRSSLRPFTASVAESNKRVPIAHRGNRIVDISFPPHSVRFNCSDGIYAAGDHSTAGIDAKLLDSVEIRDGENLSAFRFRLPSRYSPLKVQELLDEGASFLIPKVPFRPSYIRRGGTPKTIRSLWTWQNDPGIPTNEDAYSEQRELFDVPFRYAKPTALLRRIMEVASDPNDIVLDPFGGSGTTAVAAIQTGRSYVIVEEREELISQYISPRVRAAVSEALQA